MTLKEILKSPFAKVSAGLGGILAVLNPDMLFVAGDALLASAPQLFTAASIGALTMPQVLPPQTTTDWVVVVSGVLFLAYLAKGINDNFEMRGL